MLANSNRTDEMTLHDLARRFAWFADHVFKATSPLYEQFARGVAGDKDLLALAAYADSHQPVPVLLFGAVHDVLLSGVHHPLAAFYPDLAGLDEPPDEDPFRHFKAFCREHRAAIRKLLTTRRVQTNEVRRCTALMPALSRISAWSDDSPLALVEIGASAGLNLLWDQYAYDYGSGTRIGPPDADVSLTCSVRGNLRPPLPDLLPLVVSRVGVDLHPVDVVGDPEQARWLRALIWPEHLERAALLNEALGVVRRDPPRMVEGNALDLLPGLLSEAPSEAELCVVHSYVLNQFSAEAREELAALLESFSRERPLNRVSVEWIDGGPVPSLCLTEYRRGAAQESLLARCDQHGAWLEWLASAG